MRRPLHLVAVTIGWTTVANGHVAAVRTPAVAIKRDHAVLAELIRRAGGR